MTSQELLALFSQATGIVNSDQFLIHSAAGVGGNKAVKVTAEAVRAYLLARLAVTIGADGYIYIGGENTGYKAEGVTPELERRSDGIYCSIDHGTTWTCIAYFSDFGYTALVNQTDTQHVTIAPEVLNLWGSVSSLSILYGTAPSGAAAEYKLQFTVGSDNFTLTLPSGTRWSEEPEWENGNTYQVSIQRGLALYAEWEAAGT